MFGTVIVYVALCVIIYYHDDINIKVNKSEMKNCNKTLKIATLHQLEKKRFHLRIDIKIQKEDIKNSTELKLQEMLPFELEDLIDKNYYKAGKAISVDITAIKTNFPSNDCKADIYIDANIISSGYEDIEPNELRSAIENDAENLYKKVIKNI